jgi:hypothetical protein
VEQGAPQRNRRVTRKRISSRSTFLFKRVYPVIFFGGTALIFAMPLIGLVTVYDAPPVWFLIPAGLLALVLGWLIMRTVIFGLADEVYDEGDALLVRINGREDRILLPNIAAVRYATWLNPGKVTVTLKQPCSFGAEIAFLPPTRPVCVPRQPGRSGLEQKDCCARPA